MIMLLLALISLLLIGAAITVGFWWGSHGKPVVENISSAQALRQQDGSVVAERVPQQKPGPAPHRLPKGSIEERRMHVVVKPSPAAAKLDASGAAYCDCGPVAVDLSLVRVGDGRRVVASSPDGNIISALDVPIEPALIPPEPKRWAAGVSYDPAAHTPGIWLERDLARIRLGVEVQQRRDGNAAARFRVGWVF
ncbi:hypothetical protein [Andreprevotia sp. IGB-42]|uniref:hypothetical protein n=1 Tax=Andreprevotia sp. IGB-42 TaxID=2497473 RepID=UPI0013592D40|nr:hypothetical protein [Andreprevotia sp. IGB-42]